MENVPSSVVMAVSGIIIGCVLISFFLFNYKTTKNVTSQGVAQQDEVVSNFDESRYTKYETMLSGAEAIAALKDLAKDDSILIYVDNGVNTVRYANSSMSTTSVQSIENDTDMSSLTLHSFAGSNPEMLDKNKKDLIKKFSDRANKDTNTAYFIDKTDHYQGYVLRNKSSHRITVVTLIKTA